MTLPSNTSLPPRPDRKAWFRRLTTGLALAFMALCGLVVLLVPPAGARPATLGTQSIIINEVAWMGTQANANAEWIELFNPGSTSIPINGWILQTSEATPSVNVVLNGSIPAGGFFLLERTADSTVSNVPADQIYTGALNNAGTTIRLWNAANDLIDTVNISGGAWPAGSNASAATRCSMERIGPLLDEPSSWMTSTITNIGLDGQTPSNPICGSPKAQNSQFITPTATFTPTATPPWQRRILINEVAWGGTQADPAGQWIELYNPSLTDPVDITGWRLVAGDGSPNIVIDTGDPANNIIPPNGYFLLARRADVFQGSTPAIQQVFTAPLDITGETLRLESPFGDLVDTANGNGGPWPSGGGFLPYASMERTGSFPETDQTWVTFAGTPTIRDNSGVYFVYGTPGEQNWGVGLIPTPSPTATGTATATATVTPTLTLTRTITPTPGSSMAIVINEVAWMGTGASSNDEWIELYNPGATDVNITGWRLATTDNNPPFSITLSGTIPAGGYFLLERTDDSTISDITADQIYSGSLNDSGRVLRLYSSASNTTWVDSANGNISSGAGGVWPAGDITKRCSMERGATGGIPMQDSDSAWITNGGVLKNGKDANGSDICGTPKNVNWAYYVTPNPQKTSTPARVPTRTRTPAPNRATPEPVVINEFLPHARSDYNGDGVIDSGDEFIELINLGSVAVTLNNYQLDDQQGDSNPYTITGVTLQPGTRIAFFASQTGILLSNGGDSVRLYKPNGRIADAFTYGVLKELDRSWCRYPDGKFTVAGQSNWTFGCLPSPAKPNELASAERIGMEELPLICKSPKLPFGIYLTECDRLGLWNWNSAAPPLPLLPPWLEAGGMLFIFE